MMNNSAKAKRKQKLREKKAKKAKEVAGLAVIAYYNAESIR
mgnify:CR=1 FL=1